MDSSTPELVVVTGLSGAGRSTAVAALEDLGYFCVDNLPTPVVPATLRSLHDAGVVRVALGIDVRVGAFFAEAADVVGDLIRDGRYAVRVIFLDASDEVLLRRFAGTRRPHPLSQGALGPKVREPRAVLDGVRMEREQLSRLRVLATSVIDTTALSVHELRRRVIELLSGSCGVRTLRTRIVSFGFKYGCPMDADVVLDVRFLSNPFFVESLRDRLGTDPDVSRYVLDNPEGRGMLARSLELLRFCIPGFEKEGRSYVTVAVGCTGGMHRSVAMAEALATCLAEELSLRIDVIHRDATREGASVRAGGPSEPPLTSTAAPDGHPKGHVGKVDEQTGRLGT
jgi:RNase adapter protein RapZ